MKCPRCDSKKIEIMAKSPVGNVWEVYLCGTCKFSWRSTEGENITNPDKYEKRFKLNPEEFDQIAVIPPITVPIKQE